jgi:diaminopimelate epimerase
MGPLTLWKYHGGGNDFLLTEQAETVSEWFQREGERRFIQALTHRQFGIGADGFLLLQESHSNQGSSSPLFSLTYWNSDGSSNTFCGNGGRVAGFHFKKRNPSIPMPFTLEGWDGLHQVKRFGSHFGISFQLNPELQEVQVHETKGFQIHTGSPHFVWTCSHPIFDDPDFLSHARSIRYSPLYQKEGINVNGIYLSENGIQIRTYERGVENETLSCGTGILAAAIVYWKLGGKANPITLQAKGGSFQVYQEGPQYYWLIGPVTFVFKLTLSPSQIQHILLSFQNDYYEMQSLPKP